MKKNTPRWPMALLACLPLAAAAQQAVWRCGNSYSERPCAGGTEIDARPVQPAAQEAERALAAARRDAQLADAMERDRLVREKQAGRAVIIANAPGSAQPPQASASGTKKGKKGKKGKGKPEPLDEPELVTIKVPASGAARPAQRK